MQHSMLAISTDDVRNQGVGSDLFPDSQKLRIIHNWDHSSGHQELSVPAKSDFITGSHHQQGIVFLYFMKQF